MKIKSLETTMNEKKGVIKSIDELKQCDCMHGRAMLNNRKKIIRKMLK